MKVQASRILTPFLLILLSACGGSMNQDKLTPAQQMPPVATQEFLSLAKSSSCAEYKNRLFIIDQQYVLWDKAGKCNDASYSQTLYAQTPQSPICQSADSIAGPRLSCSNQQWEANFKIMITNLDKPDLGLGMQHHIQSIKLSDPTTSSVSLPLHAYHSRFYYHDIVGGITLLSDSAWETFWKNAGTQPDARDSKPNFNDRMVIGSFFKTPNNCSLSQILRVSSNGTQLSAEVIQQERVSVQSCDPNSAKAATPMSLVETRRLELPVNFVNVSQDLVPQQNLGEGAYSRISHPKQVLIKDQSNWVKLWQEHQGESASLPSVNFNTHMVIGIFLGNRHNGCYGIEDVHVWRRDGINKVSYRAVEPGTQSICTQQITSPYILILVPRNEDAIDFNTVQISV